MYFFLNYLGQQIVILNAEKLDLLSMHIVRRPLKEAFLASKIVILD